VTGVPQAGQEQRVLQVSDNFPYPAIVLRRDMEINWAIFDLETDTSSFLQSLPDQVQA
jgi:hypothetical protein